MSIGFGFPMFGLAFTVAVGNRTASLAFVKFCVGWFWFITIGTEGGVGIDGRRWGSCSTF